MLNPVIAADIADTLHTAINAISLILLVPIGVGIVYTMVRAIGIVIENQKE